MVKSRLHLRQLVWAVLLVLITTTSSTKTDAADTVTTPGIARYSYGVWASEGQRIQAAVVGTSPVGWFGEYDYWRALIQFSIPQGIYSAATLTFTTSPYSMWGPNVPDPYDPPPIRVGISGVLKSPFVDYNSPYQPTFGGGASFGTIDMTWPASFTLSMNAVAMAQINSAEWYGVAFTPLDYVPDGYSYPLPRVAEIQNAVLQLTPAVPEPSEWAMLMVGLAVIGSIGSRRKQTIGSDSAAA